MTESLSAGQLMQLARLAWPMNSDHPFAVFADRCEAEASRVEATAASVSPAGEARSKLECEHIIDKYSKNRRCLKCGQNTSPTTGDTRAAQAGAMDDEAGRVKPVATRLGEEAQPLSQLTPQDGASSTVPAGEGSPHSYLAVPMTEKTWRCRHCGIQGELATLPTYGCLRTIRETEPPSATAPLTEWQKTYDRFGVVRVEYWPEGLVLWVGGEIVWRSFDLPRKASGAQAGETTLPCPFCNAVPTKADWHTTAWFAKHATKCPQFGMPIHNIEAWNTRAAKTGKGHEVGALGAMLVDKQDLYWLISWAAPRGEKEFDAAERATLDRLRIGVRSPAPRPAQADGGLLLPCECGEWNPHLTKERHSWNWSAWCDCGRRKWGTTREEAIAAWNTRHPVPPATQQGTEDGLLKAWSNIQDHASVLSRLGLMKEIGDRMAQRIREQRQDLEIYDKRERELANERAGLVLELNAAETRIHEQAESFAFMGERFKNAMARATSAEAESKAKDERIAAMEKVIEAVRKYEGPHPTAIQKAINELNDLGRSIPADGSGKI